MQNCAPGACVKGQGKSPEPSPASVWNTGDPPSTTHPPPRDSALRRARLARFPIAQRQAVNPLHGELFSSFAGSGGPQEENTSF